jgi:hypothetical protein
MNNAMTKDRAINWKILLCCGIFIWFAVNLLQGIFTEIQEDEAYYALYGEHLAWGYYDHPPMVGVMTYLSSIFFSGTLGVRFLTIIISCLSLFVIWKIASLDCFVVPPRNDAKRQLSNSQLPTDSQLSTLNSTLLFFTLAFSIVMFNIYGFVTTPDASLILFSALFLLVYQRYLEESTWPKALLMGLTMALMIYSKYHAFLLLGLVVLSNLKLLKDGKFWVACLVALALLTPHILWQVDNGFPSFKYHLAGRNEAFRWSYFLEYLPNQLLVFNPLTVGAVVYVLIKYRADNAFERSLRFILIGFFFFFWLMAFRGHVEPHWTIVCVIPAVVLVYRAALVDTRLLRYVKWGVLPSLLLVVAFRIVLLTPMASRLGFGGKEAYYQAIEQVAGDRPVAFQGSFQHPALYHYFTGKPSSTLRCYYDRMTQYDLWQFDKAWIGEEVMVCSPISGLSTTFEVDGERFEGFISERFQTANRLEAHLVAPNAWAGTTPVVHPGDTLTLEFTLHNPCDAPLDFRHEQLDMGLRVLFLTTNDFSYARYDKIGAVAPHATYEGRLTAIVGEDVKPGRNRIALGVNDRIATFATAGTGINIEIQSK